MSKLASILGMSILTSNPYDKFLIFGMDNDMKNVSRQSQYRSSTTKPNKRRSKTKQARKQKHRR